MGFPFDGLKSLKQSVAATIADLVGQDIVAKSISLTQALGADAVYVTVRGAFLRLGTATTSRMYEDSSGFIHTSGRFVADDAVVAVNGQIQAGTYLHALGGNARLYLGASTPAIFGNAPTISSGFGAGASIASNNGTYAFTVNTGAASASGVIGLPTATTGWICTVQNTTTNTATVFLTKQTAGATNSVTIGNFDAAGASQNWVANDVLRVIAFAF